MSDPNFYHLLGLSREASPGEVRAAYIRALKQHHPDHARGVAGAERLHQIQRAYRCLRDPVTRAGHDLLLDERERAHARAVRRVQRRIRRLEHGRPRTPRRSAVGKLQALAAMSGGGVLLWLLLMS